ncbi:hypothetical protein [Rhodopirellula sallentina]|uniref:Uncharacterized protein n=1 Tax=Rhodopirellula sallentina SM41 TaxID=1263870 RepID=M5TZ29_9BACT|nr:hypothetical protein [Rhodopirellula sallentina]EMI54269.1 hypothetical protein RSSM_04260 [Rhodopirellula sallentina SM41]
MAKKQRIPHKFQPWIDARRKFHLSHKHIQMARELGLSPKKFGGYADRDKKPWKLPLPEFIEHLYEKQFGRKEPEEILTMEEIAAAHVAKRAERKRQKELQASSEAADSNSSPSPEPVAATQPNEDGESSQTAEPHKASDSGSPSDQPCES